MTKIMETPKGLSPEANLLQADTAHSRKVFQSH
jgi:hypothetical protein